MANRGNYWPLRVCDYRLRMGVPCGDANAGNGSVYGRRNASAADDKSLNGTTTCTQLQ